jgi:hypothetical protein
MRIGADSLSIKEQYGHMLSVNELISVDHVSGVSYVQRSHRRWEGMLITAYTNVGVEHAVITRRSIQDRSVRFYWSSSFKDSAA